MISVFTLWNFHLYVVTFQQHMYIEYISLSWYGIPELVVSLNNFLDRELLLTRKLQSQWFLVVNLKSLGKYLCRRWHGNVPFYRSHYLFLLYPSSWLINRFLTRLTRRVPLVEREVHTLPEHLSSLPVFQWGFVFFNL